MGNERLRSRVRDSVLKHKIFDAKGSEQNNRNKFNSRLNYLNRRWGHNGFIMGKFREIMQKEVELLWNKLRNKNQNKISHLVSKWKDKNSEIVGEWRNILISDEKLKEQFDDPVIVPINEDNIELSEAETKVLMKPPKFTTYDRVDITKVEVAAECLINKLRWKLRSKAESGGIE